MFTGDGAGCDLNRLRSTRHSIAIAHYFKFNTSSTACGNVFKDVAVPPHVPKVHRTSYLMVCAPLPSYQSHDQS